MSASARIEELKKKFDENPRRYFAPLANEFRKMGDFDQAILICQEFLPQQPGHMSGHIVFGQALYEAGRFDEARNVFETALSLDPENLIALRHLGDIARAGGDIDGARSWYRRVLDADPRNEEIASVLASIDEPASIPWTTPTPRSMPTVAPPLGEFAVSPTADEAAARPAEPVIEQPLESVPPQRPPADFASVLEEARRQVAEAEAAAQEPELLDLEGSLSFDQEQTRVTTGAEDLGVERAMETPFGFEPSTFESPASGAAGALEGLEPTTADDRAEAAPLEGLEPTSPDFPPSVGQPLELVESAEFVPPTRTEEPRPGTGSAQPPAGGEALFESFEMPEEKPRERAEEEKPVPTAPAAAMAPKMEEPPRSKPEPPSAPRPEAAPGGFVTETMAELYVRQGHIAEAVGVYRQLVTRYPNDEVFGARLAELTVLLESEATTRAATPAHEEPAAAAHEVEEVAAPPVPEERKAEALGFADAEIEAAMAAGHPAETIREFLSALATRGLAGGNGTGAEPARVEYSAPPTREMPEIEPAEETAAPSVDLPFLDVGDTSTPPSTAVREEPAPQAAARYTPPETQPTTVAGSIDALFAGAESSGADEEAASLLAGAFAGAQDEEPPIAGKPARRAQDELSLDHVFRERSTTAERGQPAFSFDQFFSQEATDAGTSGEPASASHGDRDDDIQQFNAWLEGLKKT